MSSQSQSWDPHQYQSHAAYVAELGKAVVALLAPQDGERVFDLGCGDGVLTAEIARFGCHVTGIDASTEMVAAAKAAGVDAQVGDGAALAYSEEFDAVFSNATLHWITDVDAVLSGVWRALRPGGRFVGEFGGIGNVATIIGALEASLADRGVEVASPWYFPTSEEYAARLERTGFTVTSIELFARPTPLPGDVRGWIETFAKHYLLAVSETKRDGLITEVVDKLQGTLSDTEGNWFADYVRLRFRAEKPRAAA